MKKKAIKPTIRQVAIWGMMIALAMILSYVEAQIPPLFAFPGMKLGLTNIVVLLALYQLGNTAALTVNLLRIVLVSVLFGTFSSFIYSLAGGTLSTVLMLLMKNIFRLRTVTVSIVGGVTHNIGQIVTAMVLMNTAGLGWYMGVLWFTGLITGALIGILGNELIKRLPDKLFRKGS